MCGIAGAMFPKNIDKNNINPTKIVGDMITAQLHRGEESYGLYIAKPGVTNKFIHLRGGELTGNEKENRLKLDQKWGHAVIGQNRYGTTGTGDDDDEENEPPSYLLCGDENRELLATAHNGNLTSELTGPRPGTSDSWNITMSFWDSDTNDPIYKRIFNTLRDKQGAFSLIFLFQDGSGKVSMVCARDPYGFRPLWLGTLEYKQGGKVKKVCVAASETRAFDVVGAKPLRPVDPGEIVVINEDGAESYKNPEWRGLPQAKCVFEIVYFAHPGSVIEIPGYTPEDYAEKPVYFYQIRKELGREWARENSEVKADFFTSVPASATHHAEGAIEELTRIKTEGLINRTQEARENINLEESVSNFFKNQVIRHESAIIRNMGSKRTFIDPEDREEKIRKKFSFLADLFRKVSKIYIFEDSIVRGTTLNIVIKDFIKKFNSDIKIGLGIMSPPKKYPCYYGEDTPTSSELIVNRAGSVDGARNELGVDELYYLSIQGMCRAIKNTTGIDMNEHCLACFNNEYKSPINRKSQIAELVTRNS